MTVRMVYALFIAYCLLSVPVGIAIGKFLRGPK